MAKIKRNFSLGIVSGERDPLLSTGYWDNGDYSSVANSDDRRCFLIGRTGSGKSALLLYLEENYRDKVIRIVPENLSMRYIMNLDVIQFLIKKGVHLDLFFKTLWKHVITVEVLKHRYHIDSQVKKINIINQLIERFKNDPSKKKAIEYINEFGEKFWCETDERIKEIAEKFEKKFKASAGLDIPMGASSQIDLENVDSQETQTEIIQRFQRIVNDVQIARLNEMNIILDEILDKQHTRYVVIDDLDKEWVNESLANNLIRCLFQTVEDMSPVKNLKIIVALRTNIFDQLNYGSLPRGNQVEKLRGISTFLNWNEHDLRNMLEVRTQAASTFYKLDPPRTLSSLLPKKNSRAGDPVDYILRRTLMKPRDVIDYINRCIIAAAGKEQVSWQEIHQAEKDYSKNRLDALRDEWKDPYLDIQKVFECFRDAPCKLNRHEYSEIFENIALLIADSKFQGTHWLTDLVSGYWNPTTGLSWFDIHGYLTILLYNISFIGISKSLQAHSVYSYQDPSACQNAKDLPETVYFEIHPAFWKALEISEENDPALINKR